MDIQELASGINVHVLLSSSAPTETADGLTATLARMDEASGVGSAAAFVEVKLALGTREELGRPTVSTHECKEALMAFLEE